MHTATPPKKTQCTARGAHLRPVPRDQALPALERRVLLVAAVQAAGAAGDHQQLVGVLHDARLGARVEAAVAALGALLLHVLEALVEGAGLVVEVGHLSFPYSSLIRVEWSMGRWDDDVRRHSAAQTVGGGETTCERCRRRRQVRLACVCDRRPAY